MNGDDKSLGGGGGAESGAREERSPPAVRPLQLLIDPQKLATPPPTCSLGAGGNASLPPSPVPHSNAHLY